MATTTKTATTFKTRIDIEPDARKELVGLLNQQMADNADLYSQTKQAHWNVKGPDFMQLHLLFDQVAAMVEPFTDELAERVTALGGYATGTVRMAAEATTLQEFPIDARDGKAHLEALADAYSAYAASTRQAIERASQIGEPTTEDLFTEISRDVDKALYFIEGHLQG
ncbi:MAG: DNA starvation/stationary phase protection protein Dps [Trueperaceae bacterium]|nr:DNA starvation/stationary phase protection protein Dps [Trueperaceae bacterium]